MIGAEAIKRADWLAVKRAMSPRCPETCASRCQTCGCDPRILCSRCERREPCQRRAA